MRQRTRFSKRFPHPSERGKCRSARIQKTPFCGAFAEPSDGLEPSTPSLPWRFGSVTRVHARSLASMFVLQIGSSARDNNERACPDVLGLAYPSRTRLSLSVLQIENG